MAEITNGLIYKILQDLQAGQAEHRDQLREFRAQIAVLAQGQVNICTELQCLRSETRDVKSDLQRVSLHLQEVAIILDHHGRRLDAIEHHLGIDKAKH